MDYENTYEREVDLKELMFAVLRKWRLILLFIVILAVLLGGYKGISAHKSQSNAADEASYEEALKDYNENLEICQREIENLTKNIENQEEYIEKSVLMNISPYDVWEAKADFFIKTDSGSVAGREPDVTALIMRAYQSSLTSGEFLSEIADGAGIDVRYLQEVITVNLGLDELTALQNNNLLSGRNEQNSLLTITVRHKDETKAKELLEGIIDGIERFQSKIRSSIGDHTVVEISKSVNSRVDLSLADRQSTENNRLTVLKESLKTKTEELKGIKIPETAGTSFIKDAIKYAVIGGVLGAFMVIFFICISFIMSDKVYSAKELKFRFKVKVLGRLPLNNNMGKIDRWLNQLEGRAGGTDKEHEYSLICANIHNYAENVQSLMVAGCAGEELLEQVTSELKDRLSDMKVVSGGNLLRNAEGLQILPECDGIILVEQCGESLYGDVELEIEKACDLQKSVVGCIVFE